MNLVTFMELDGAQMSQLFEDPDFLVFGDAGHHSVLFNRSDGKNKKIHPSDKLKTDWYIGNSSDFFVVVINGEYVLPGQFDKLQYFKLSPDDDLPIREANVRGIIERYNSRTPLSKLEL